MTNLELSRGAYEAARIAGNGRLDLRVDDGDPKPTTAAVLRPALTALSALVFPTALLGVWTLSSHFGWLPAQILPSPDQVAATLADLADSGDLWFHTRISLLRVVEGFSLGGAAGLLLGIAMGLSQRVRWTVEPLFTALAQVPPLGWIPVLMLLVGIDEGLKLLIIAKAALIPVALNTHKGIRNVPDSLREVGSVLTFGPLATLTRIVLPAAVPSIFTGIRYGLTSAWLALVAVELLASSEGLGYLMVWGRQLFQLDMVIAAMLVVGLIGFALDWTLSRVERRLQRWELAGS